MKAYSEILPLSKPPAHERSIRVQTARFDNDHIQLRAELADERADGFQIHGMIVRLKIRRDLIITEAEFATPRAPFKECSIYKVGPEKLVGLSAGKGFTKTVLAIYGGVRGCSHIVTILVTLSAAVRQGGAFALYFPDTEQTMTEKSVVPTVQKMAQSLEDTCMSWGMNSPLQKDIEGGLIRDIPERLYPSFHRKNSSTRK